MNENTPPEENQTELGANKPEATTQTIDPVPTPATSSATTQSAPGWALDKFKRNTVIGGAAVAGAVVALAGAALVGDDDHRGRGDFRGGPPMMQGGPMQGGPGQQGGGQFEQRGPGGPGMQGPGMQGQGNPGQGNGTQEQQGPSGKSGSN